MSSTGDGFEDAAIFVRPEETDAAFAEETFSAAQIAALAEEMPTPRRVQAAKKKKGHSETTDQEEAGDASEKVHIRLLRKAGWTVFDKHPFTPANMAFGDLWCATPPRILCLICDGI